MKRPRLPGFVRSRLPSFVHSLRFRLTVLYSTLLFALAAVVLGGIYFAVSVRTDAKPITTRYAKEYTNGVYNGRKIQVGEISEVEQAVNYQTLETVRQYSFGMLGGLFLASMGIGWVLSGRVLRPVRAITQTAQEIQATDLSRRIRLAGPQDELKQLADTIDSMLDRLDDAFRAQRQLIDDASHELRSPLAIIKANLDTVLTTRDATPEEHHRAALVVDRATGRMTRLVEDLLATARRSAPALHDGDVDLGVIAREAAEDFDSLAAERGLVIDRRLTEGLHLIGDPDALRRGLGNLLSNAVRLAPAGTRVTVATGAVDGWLWTAVRDSGPGIRPDDQDRVFDRFWRGPEGRRSRDRRTGLGLAIVRHITESHGGAVRLFSSHGVGSTFVLWFPGPERPTPPPPETDPLG